MYRCSGFKFKILVCLIVISGICLPADAYVLKGEHVIQLMMEKNKLPGRLSVHQTVSFIDSDIVSGIDSVDGTGNPPVVDALNTGYEQHVRYQIPGRFRADIYSNGLDQIHAVSSDQSLTVIDGRVVSESERWTDHYKDLFLYRSREQLVDRLEFLGIDFSVTSLGRYQGTICFILGAQYPDESVPQLWISKDTFRPMRWVYAVSVVEDQVEQKEILYSDWEKHYQIWYPSIIEFFENRTLVQRIAVQKVEINPSFSGDLFDIEKLKSHYPLMTPATTPTGHEDINKRIEEFKNIYE